jgi:hypothetical protein
MVGVTFLATFLKDVIYTEMFQECCFRCNWRKREERERERRVRKIDNRDRQTDTNTHTHTDTERDKCDWEIVYVKRRRGDRDR